MERLAVSINDAATMLGLGRTSIYQLIGEEKLDSFTLDRRRLVTLDVLPIFPPVIS